MVFSYWAFPPHPGAGSSCEIGRSQIAILGGVPFGGDFWAICCQIVEADEDFLATTDWAAPPLDPVANGALPLVVWMGAAFPPHLLL
jgi:hypothetical protein